MHLIGIAQSLGLFFIVCLATAALLSVAVAALARMERATIPARHPVLPPVPRTRATTQRLVSERVPGARSCSYGPRGR